MAWNLFGKKETRTVISQRDIDIIRVKAEAITSTSDKVYLIEELYKQADAVQEALSLLESPETAQKVRQSRDELLRLQQSIEETRAFIIDSRIPEKRYGLFVKYPKGYEG